MNILLLTDMPPCKNYTAGIVLNILCDFLIEEGNKVDCYCIKNSSVNAIVPEDKESRMSIKCVVKPNENYGNRKFNKIASFWGNSVSNKIILNKYARDIAEFANEHKCQMIWAAVQGGTMIRIVRPAAQKAKIPYCVQIWDPPQWWLKENNFDSISFRSVMKEYKNLLESAECCLTASWAMSSAYEEEYNCKRTVPVILGFEDQTPKRYQRERDDYFIIALSGQIYAQNEFKRLLDSLDLMKWEYGGRKILLRLYGRYFHLYFNNEANIEIRGWLQQPQLLEDLEKADLLYCPYWFSKKYEEPCRLSFPSKLSTYLKTGTAVLFHGPEYASPGRFLRDNNAGYICMEQKPEKIAECLKKIMDDNEIARVGERGYIAFKNNFTLSHMKKAFLDALFGGSPEKEE